MVELSARSRRSAKQTAFLAAFAKTGNITLAARVAQVGRRDHYDWLEKADYVTAFHDADDEACELMEAEALRRAMHGVTRAVFYQGNECGKVQEYSDNLLMFLLKGRRPEKYRENSKIEHTGAGGAPMSIEVTFVKAA